MKEFINHAIKRAASDTPPFFKKLRNWAGIVGGACLGLQGVPFIPGWGRIVLGVISAICGGIAGTSMLGTTNKTLSEK